MEAKYLEVFPTTANFSKKPDKEFYEANLSLNNITNQYVIFKIYINKNTVYTANPSTSFLRPSDSTTVKITRQERTEPTTSQSNDKFLIMAMTTNQNEQAKVIFKKEASNRDNNQTIYLTAHYEKDTMITTEGNLRDSLDNKQVLLTSVQGRKSLNEFLLPSQPFNTQDNERKSFGSTKNDEISEMKKQISEIKGEIEHYTNETNRLSKQLENLSKNSHILKTMSGATNQHETKTKATYSLNQLIFFSFLAIIFGGYFRRYF